MGLPYSRQINAAFEQVTPLVAAGFKVLRTTRDISILLAVIQVLTVVLLGFILAALVLLLYCVNPDLEVERQQIITPWLRYLASITIFSVVKTVVWMGLGLGVCTVGIWHFFLAKKWVEDVEYEGNVDADLALEDLGEGK
ncbi:conserved hypothetical protein [Pyrenophora tritici-repentis Pt-1C-BFP]|uniref:Uncharacterized protein n=1 Tax=Pyrenophora tritici-repentis (strain Pt-1C-BFP) TaxID=426418 RepID=B2W6P2_PYRTR|nr:uncharacterized protein PTRG_05480 [Pyrenophora tritici-repentis Pt-1C-BFP]EDU48400.1 conserved hypothetical protein [Pyrenophora tritici-repentis Pt-1C-BFP]